MATDGEKRNLDHTPPPFFEQRDDEDLIQYWVNQVSWKAWEGAYRPYWRLVDENVRMLSGRQYDMFVDQVGDFVDLSSYFLDDFEAWRDYPTYNWFAHWYKLTLSKLTENIPAMGYMPSTGDQKDALTAQIMEPFFKYEWDQMDMPELMFDLYGWCLVAGRGIIKLKWDPDRGKSKDFTGPAIFNQIGADNLVTQRQLSDAPYTKLDDGNFGPAFQLGGDGEVQIGPDGLPVFGAADSQREGDLAAEIISPVNVIVPHGSDPFHLKPWYTHEYMMPIDEAERRFGMADLEKQAVSLKGDMDLPTRLSFGTHYGMPSDGFQSVTKIDDQSVKGMVRVREKWMRDVPGDKILNEGRLTIVIGEKVAYDDINPFYTESHPESVMVFEAYDLIRYPFRQEGTTDGEIMRPILKALNRRLGAMLDAVDYHEQPIKIVDRNANIDETGDELNKRGAVILVNMTGTQSPIQHIEPPPLPQGSVELFSKLEQMAQTLGSQPFGSEGLPVTNDASGELQKEVRFDTDRVWGATLRRHSYIHARLAIKMKEIAAACMDDERLLVISGEDQAFSFLTLGADVFSGKVNVKPNPESQQLESRQEKQNRILSLHSLGLLLPEQVLDQLGYPNLARLTRPGGQAYALAQRENMEMALGDFPVALSEHDHATHILVHRKEQQSVWYRDAGEELQGLFNMHVQFHEILLQQETLRQAALQAPIVQAAAALGAAAGGSTTEEAQSSNGGPANNGNGGGPGDDPRSQAAAPAGADPQLSSLAR